MSSQVQLPQWSISTKKEPPEIWHGHLAHTLVLICLGFGPYIVLTGTSGRPFYLFFFY